MHILFFIGHLGYGGAERVVVSLSKKFVEYGHRVTIITFDDGESFYQPDSRVKKETLRGLKSSSNPAEALSNNVKNIVCLRKKLKRLAPDVAVCFSVSTLLTCTVAAAFLGIKIVGTERSNPYMSLSGSLWKPMKKIISLFADGFIFQTQRAMNFYPPSVRRKGIVIPNAVFVEENVFLHLPQDREKTICAVGMLREVKGFDALIKAFYLVADKIPDYNLVIYGEGAEREALQGLIDSLGLGDRVKLPGQVSEILREISKAGLFVLSSRHEGMPNALIEAMACGLPCIATDCAMGPRELITDGVNGILVPVDDLEAMAEAICRVIGDPELALRLGSAAAKIRQTNSVDVIAGQYLDYLTSVHKGG